MSTLKKPAPAPGNRMRLLDIGCGWGATARRAAEKFGARVIGLTLSRNQYEHNVRMAESLPQIEFRLQGWEEFDEPVDRIVSIGAFEHFRMDRYSEFFAKCRGILPAPGGGGGGRMLLHTIVQTDWNDLRQSGVEITHEDVLFAKFIREKIFPGGQLCTPRIIIDHAQRAGFTVTHTQSLRMHYARTLDLWSANLRAAKPRAVELTSPETYEMYMKYLTGCAKYFRSGHNDVIQFTCVCRS